MNGNVQLNSQKVLNDFFNYRNKGSCFAKKQELKVNKGELVCTSRGIIRSILPGKSHTIKNLPSIVDYCIGQEIAHEKLSKKIEKYNAKNPEKQISDEQKQKVNELVRKLFTNEAISAARTNNLATLTELSGKYDAPVNLVLELCQGSNAPTKECLEKITVEGSIDAKDDQGFSAIYYAVKNNHFDAVQFLIEKDAKLDWTNADGQNLMYFVKDVRIAELLDKANPELVKARDVQGRPAAYQAIVTNNSDVALFLLNQDTDACSYRDAEQQNLMHLVHDLKIAEKLHVLNPALIYTPDSHGKKPYYAAILNKQEAIFEWMIGALDPSILFEKVDIYGTTFLMVILKECTADFANKMFDMAYGNDVAQLKTARAGSFQQFATEGETYLHFAAQGQSTEVVQKLINLGLEVDILGSAKEYAIMTPFEKVVAQAIESFNEKQSISLHQLQMIHFLVNELKANTKIPAVAAIREKGIKELEEFFPVEESSVEESEAVAT